MAGQAASIQVLAMPISDPSGAGASPPAARAMLGDDVNPVAGLTLDLKPVYIVIVIGERHRATGTNEFHD